LGARKYFGTDGIRGRVGEGPINPEFVLRLGNAVGRVLARPGRPHPIVVIGKDTRISGYMFESALEAGLVAAGADVRMLGPMPTPAVAVLTRSLRADAGIVISASHNPHQDNGIKLFSRDGEKLDDATEAAIEAALDGPLVTLGSEQLGKASRIDDAATRYVEFCKGTVPEDFDLRGLRIALDCAHGATYHVGPKLFGELGAEVDAVGVAPDGLNINHNVGSTHLDTLVHYVQATGADLGIAFDGDGDRLQMVDSLGTPVDGDDLLYLLATDWQASGRLRGPVVGTLMSNYGLERALGERGIPFLRTKVGDRYVHQALVAGGGILGGETSGHLLCLDSASTGDGIVSALQVLESLQRRGLGLREALSGLHKIAQKTINVRIAAGSRPLEAGEVRRELESIEARLEGCGRVVLRPSGTEPVVRVTVEAEDTELLEDCLRRLSKSVAAAA
jgi:phosphoglucosamine mutase